MAGFRRMQTGEQHSGCAADCRCEQREPLAGSRFDEGAADHEVNLALRLGARNQTAQRLRVTPRRQPLRDYSERGHQLGDLLVMTQFLAGNP
jgi:hypothetical protein